MTRLTCLIDGCLLASTAAEGNMKKSCRLMMTLALAAGCTMVAHAQKRSPTAVDRWECVRTPASRDGKAAAPRPAPASTTKPNAEAGSTYRLDGATATLNPHVVHKVQVTGAIEASTAGTSGSTDPASAANAPRLKVESIKMLSETCAR